MVSVWFGVLVAVLAVAYWRLASRNVPGSVVVLAFEYLSRPHQNVEPGHRFTEINKPYAWNGSYMAAHPEIWSDVLSLEEQKSVHESVLNFEKLNKSMEEMTKEDFVFAPEILKKFEQWKYQLGPDGRGFQVIRAVPVHLWTMKQCEVFYWAFGKYLGLPGAQDSAGNLLGHVIDVGPTNVTERPYRTKEDIAYHCDGSDIVGLLCINGAKSGGESRIISSVAVYNQLLRQGHPRAQQYIERLFGRILLFTRKTFGLAAYFPVHPLRLDSRGTLRTYWNQEYYLRSYRHAENGSLTAFGEADPFALEAISAYDDILNRDLRKELPPGEELGLSMSLQQGDIQLISNHYILHARTEFVDYSQDEIAESKRALGLAPDAIGPVGKRDLLRLWVSHDNRDMPWDLYLAKQVDFARVLAGFVEGVIYYR